MNEFRPVFILSLPRSGSTLLQRLLTASGECASHSEPSFLLRLLGDGPFSDRKAPYGEFLVDRALREMEEGVPGFSEQMHQGIVDLSTDLYRFAAQGRRYFIDKTPRYALIAPLIVRYFKNAKFIFLWRHPGAVLGSVAKTWNGGHWHAAYYRMDLIHGFRELWSAWKMAGDSAFSLRYEDLIASPERVLADLGDYLELPDLGSLADRALPGRDASTLGDPTGGAKYSRISAESLDQWKSECRNWYRRRLLRRIVDAGGRERWADVGYPGEALDPEDGSARCLEGVNDVLHSLVSTAQMTFHRSIVRHLIEHRFGWRPIATFR